MKRPDAKKGIAAGSTLVRLTNGLLLKPNRRRQQETIAFHLHSPAAAAAVTPLILHGCTFPARYISGKGNQARARPRSKLQPGNKQQRSQHWNWCLL